MRHAAILAAAFGVAFAVTLGVAAAEDASQTPQPAAAPKATKAKPANAADWSGTWSGALAQVGRAKPFAFQVTLSGKSGSSSYADDHCAGKLTRAATSGGYAFYTEAISDGKFDAATGKGCIDGSLTLVKDAGGSLIATWMAAYNGKAIVAYGTLAPSP